MYVCIFIMFGKNCSFCVKEILTRVENLPGWGDSSTLKIETKNREIYTRVIFQQLEKNSCHFIYLNIFMLNNNIDFVPKN